MHEKLILVIVGYSGILIFQCSYSNVQEKSYPVYFIGSYTSESYAS